MAKQRYKFNPSSLEIEKVEVSLKQRLLQIGSYLVTAVVFAVITTTIAFQVVDSPKEKALKREIEQYKLQNQIITDQLDKIDKVVADLQHRDDDIYRIIFNTEPVPDAERNSGIGGSDRYANLEGYSSSEMLIATAKRVDDISRKLVVQSRSFDKVFALAKQKEQMTASIPAIVPIKGGAMNLISGFGFRIHPIYRTRRMHTGVDIAAKSGTPVYASGDGMVIQPESAMSGYGNYVMIDHGFGYKSLYAHLSRTAVKPGKKVKRGELIGFVGSTGLSVAPHLHYEVLKNNERVNPVNFFYNDLNPGDYEKVIQLASKDSQPLS
jgi:murein DD-endopeptidase MepM/ murein hydrolase activator NlpD